MNRAFEFVKTCVLGGLVALVPIVLTIFVLGEAIDLLGFIASPIAEWLPVEELGGLEIASVVGLVLLVGICFAAGLVLRTRAGIWLRRMLEGALLERLPGYTLIRSVSQRFGGVEEGNLFAAALVDLHGTDARVFAFVIEEHSDERFTVLVPNAPTPTVGTLYVVPGERVAPLDAAPMSVMNCFMQWGIGSGQLLRQKG